MSLHHSFPYVKQISEAQFFLLPVLQYLIFQKINARGCYFNVASSKHPFELANSSARQRHVG